MCSASMIGDYYRDKWAGNPWINTTIPNHFPQYPNMAGPVTFSPVTKEDFDKLKAEVMEMKELLKRAIKYDEVNNQPHCETEEKMELLRKVAAMVGVNLDDLKSQ